MARLEDDAMPPVVKKTSSSEFDTAIRNIQQIIADSKAAREARQAAAIERKKELDKQRQDAFAPIYERIEIARQNVLAIKEDLADGVYKGKPIVTPEPTPEPEPRKVLSDEFVGECANRKRVVTYSDGTSSTFPAPQDCGGGLTTSLIDTPTSVPTPTPVPPKPPAPPPPPPPPPKTAPLDTILFDDESVPIEIMSDMIFEDIGGHELINVARNDTINGQTVTYQPIKNLTSIQQQYNPNNIVGLQNTSDKYFANFSIKLETKLPEEGNGPDGAYVYIDTDTGDLIVELINLDPDEQIEVQISLSGTIYEAEFNES